MYIVLQRFNDYSDYTVSGGVATNTNNFEQGIGRVTGGALEYTHSDMIGTLRTTSDSVGTYTANRVYTAFGESITSNSDRYGYVGDWGYQSHSEFSYQHVGARYYDPSTGRFLQRDPIGIAGGFNVYFYVGGLPTVLVDPEGLKCNKHKECRDWNNQFKKPTTQQQIFRENLKAWGAGLGLAAMGCFLGGPVGWALFVVDAAAGLYAIWPIG